MNGIRRLLEKHSQWMCLPISCRDHPRLGSFPFLALIFNWIQSLMRRHHARYTTETHQGVPGTVSKKTGYSDFSPEAINSPRSSRSIHPLPLIPTFIPRGSFPRYSNRRVNCIGAPKVTARWNSRKKSRRYSQLKVAETVKARQVEIRLPPERKNEMESNITSLKP